MNLMEKNNPFLYQADDVSENALEEFTGLIQDLTAKNVPYVHNAQYSNQCAQTEKQSSHYTT